ncbi:ArsR/SmtB family transcription factor [Maritimibacter dapengensis]|uniref:Metalloregulator ArsR/SmtB family transcription factor n=1 Tax=Maritimibacter dapengensis TaxID=2836868 RepID=A0ABS6T769_9RHOB|nr:metalloregulator ArsR/SmtB family transcription factor [Maritimibacter dapengensis]MBV7380326.1 metalloregulator ArsR/SmtB family transcription factor [Maritimibacter dapengensis]
MSLVQTFAALADPTRLALVSQLAGGPANVSELSEAHSLSQPAISKHLKVLEKAGLIETTVQGQTRPRKLVANNLQQVDLWLNAFRSLWDARLDRLGDFLDDGEDLQ